MSWTLVYGNDAGGIATFGSVETLINAVRSGSSVKVVLRSRRAHPPLEGEYLYSLLAHTVRVRNGVVHATNTLDVSSQYRGNELLFQDDSYYYMLIASTTGTLDQVRWNVGEHVSRNHDQGRWDMHWFVD